MSTRSVRSYSLVLFCGALIAFPTWGKECEPTLGMTFEMTIEGMSPGIVKNVIGQISGTDFIEFQDGDDLVLRIAPNSGGGIPKGQFSVQLEDWFAAAAAGSNNPRDILISLLDGSGKPVATWKLVDARPARWQFTSDWLAPQSETVEEIAFSAQALQVQ